MLVEVSKEAIAGTVFQVDQNSQTKTTFKQFIVTLQAATMQSVNVAKAGRK
jgi:hypothetical protein